MNPTVDKRLKPSWLPQMTAPISYVSEYLQRNGIGHEITNIDPRECRGTQQFVDESKVKSLMGAIDNNQPVGMIYLSGANDVLDGHHRAYAAIKHPDVESVGCIKIILDPRDACALLNKIQNRFEWEQEVGNGGPEAASRLMNFDSHSMGIDQQNPSGCLPGGSIGGPPMTPPPMANGMVDEATVDAVNGPADSADATQADVPMPDEAKPVETDQGAGLVPFDTATHNPKELTLYKTKPLNMNAKTGDFLLFTKDPRRSFEYVINFENVLEVGSDKLQAGLLPTQVILQEWLPGQEFVQEAKKQGLPLEIYLSREVNRLASMKGYDAIQYGDKLVQVINKPA